MFQFLMWGDRNVCALKELHALEVAAEAIYSRQIWRFDGDLKESLVHAKENEKKHKDSLMSQLEDHGSGPHIIRYPMLLFGTLTGLLPSIVGKWAILMGNIIFENQAVFDYKAFLDEGNLDEDARRLVEENIEDEKDHIRVWEGYLWGESE